MNKEEFKEIELYVNLTYCPISVSIEYAEKIPEPVVIDIQNFYAHALGEVSSIHAERITNMLLILDVVNDDWYWERFRIRLIQHEIMLNGYTREQAIDLTEQYIPNDYTVQSPKYIRDQLYDYWTRPRQ